MLAVERGTLHDDVLEAALLLQPGGHGVPVVHGEVVAVEHQIDLGGAGQLELPEVAVLNVAHDARHWRVREQVLPAQARARHLLGEHRHGLARQREVGAVAELPRLGPLGQLGLRRLVMVEDEHRLGDLAHDLDVAGAVGEVDHDDVAVPDQLRRRGLLIDAGHQLDVGSEVVAHHPRRRPAVDAALVPDADRRARLGRPRTPAVHRLAGLVLGPVAQLQPALADNAHDLLGHQSLPSSMLPCRSSLSSSISRSRWRILSLSATAATSSTWMYWAASRRRPMVPARNGVMGISRSLVCCSIRSANWRSHWTCSSLASISGGRWSMGMAPCCALSTGLPPRMGMSPLPLVVMSACP